MSAAYPKLPAVLKEHPLSPLIDGPVQDNPLPGPALHQLPITVLEVGATHSWARSLPPTPSLTTLQTLTAAGAQPVSFPFQTTHKTLGLQWR